MVGGGEKCAMRSTTCGKADASSIGVFDSEALLATLVCGLVDTEASEFCVESPSVRADMLAPAFVTEVRALMDGCEASEGR